MAQGYELNIRDYWNIFQKRKWVILISFLAILFAAVIYTNLQPLLYRVSATIMVEPTADRSAPLFPHYMQRAYVDPREFKAYAEQVISLPVVKKATKEILFSEGISSEESLEALTMETLSSISTQTEEDANIIRIVLVAKNPEPAAKIVNAIVEVFKLENIKQKNQQTKNVREFIEQQLHEVGERLHEKEKKLRALTLKGVGTSAAFITEEISKLESKRTDLLSKYTELHPGVRMIDEQIELLKDQLKELPKEEFDYANLERDVALNAKLYNLLSERLQEAQIKEAEKVDNIVIISPAVPSRRPFSPNRPRNYLMAALMATVFALSLGLGFEHLDTSIGRIEDLEVVTKLSVIGVIPYFSEKEKDFSDLKAMFRKRGIFAPKVKREDRMKKLQSQLITTHSGNSIFVEAFRILGANIQVIFGEGDRIKGKIILLTSANPQEGKSIIVSNLAIIMSQMGYKVVLVDTDLRRAALHKIFGLQKKEKGVTDVLTGEISVEAAVKSTTDLLLGEIRQDDLLKHPWLDNLHLITAGTNFPNYPYLLNTERMDRFLDGLKQTYDVVLMDSSPVLAVSDTSIIASKTNGVVLVYRAGTTSRIALRRAQTQIEGIKGKEILKGIVLNNVTPEVSIDSYYYYYRGKYYQYKEEKEKKQSS